MDRFTEGFARVCLALLPIIGVGWVFSVPDYFDIALTFQQVVATLLGIAIAVTFIKYPYGKKPGVLELAIGLVGFACWFWMAYNFEAWIVGMADRTPDKWVPGIIALLTMMEAMRKGCGMTITILVWTTIAYAFFGNMLPGVLEADVFPPTQTILFLYADNNGVPGLVLRVVAQLVLSFIILGKLMEVSGATKFFTDLATGTMGHRRGGPAKVAVVASAAFGMISGSTVGNIMSTGIVTIPMMKRTGFQARHAAAIEAVASNGGQIAPPVMGATAFLIAEFLEVPYSDVVIAAMVPALLYFMVLFLQVDAIARRYGISGLPREELPDVMPVLKQGWIFVLPLAVLLYFLFWQGYNPGLSAMYAGVALLALSIIKKRALPTRAEWSDFIFGSGENLLPLILIAAGAGVVMGVLNSTGLAFQLSLILSAIGNSAGLLAMLALTALVSIVLGMGMPTAAVYIVLATVIGPAMVDMKVDPMAAHLFLFYFGLLSMLTPPVAVASMVAASLAGADMWRTGLVGMQLAAAAYFMPFLWVFNPALIMDGSTTEIIYAVVTTVIAGFLITYATIAWNERGFVRKITGVAMLGVTLAVGGSTVWFGSTSPFVPAAAVVGVIIAVLARRNGVIPIEPRLAKSI